jgi:hypothetical protein
MIDGVRVFSLPLRGRTHSISSIHWQLALLGLIESEALVHGADRFGFTPFRSGRVVQ